MQSGLFLLSKVSSGELSENLVDRKQGVRFGVFVVSGLANSNVFLANNTPDIDQTVHPVSYRPNFH